MSGFLRRLIMITSAISNTVYTRLVITTSIVAQLAVCAILVAGIGNAHAATKDDNSTSSASRRAATHATHKAAVKKPTARPSSDVKLAKLDRDWKQLHSRLEHGAL